MSPVSRSAVRLSSWMSLKKPSWNTSRWLRMTRERLNRSPGATRSSRRMTRSFVRVFPVIRTRWTRAGSRSSIRYVTSIVRSCGNRSTSTSA